MEWLIDTNIVLDYLTDRWPFADEAQAIWRLCETGKATGYISALSFANIVYIMRKVIKPDRIDELLQLISKVFRTADLTTNDLLKAAQLHWKDYEDAIQTVTAERLHCNAIITRNTRDYQSERVPVLSPDALLKNLESSEK